MKNSILAASLIISACTLVACTVKSGNQEKPNIVFILVDDLAYTPPHGSYIVPELGIYKDKEWSLSHKVYAAMISRVDTEIGRLMQLPVARWPEHIKPGQESDHIWAMWDFLPTAADIIGASTPERLDGISILPTLLGEPEKQQKHEFLYWEYKAEQAVRMSNRYGYKNKKGILEIYDLENNPQQDRDLSVQYPEIAKRIGEIMNQEHTPSDVWPSPGETEEAFKKRMIQRGITSKDRPENMADF